MGRMITEEIKDSKKPLLLVFTENKYLQKLIFKEFSSKLALLFVSESPPEDENGDTYHIKNSNLDLLPQLEEKIDYALVMFSTESQKENINPLLEKLKKDRCRSTVMIPADNYKKFIDVLGEVKNEPNIFPAIYGQILEDDPSLSEFLKFIRIGLSKDKVKLKGNDLMPVYPISQDDFMTCVKQLLFSSKSRGIYYLFYKEPQTLLSAIHLLARIEPELKLDIDHSKPIEQFEERSVMNQNLTDKLNLSIHYLDKHLKGFTHAIEDFEAWPDEKKSKYTKKDGKTINFKKPKFLKFSPSVSLALFSAFALFIFINIVFGILSLIFLRSSIYAFENDDFASARENGTLARSVLAVPLPTLSVAESALSYLPFMKQTYDTLNLVTSTAELTTISSSLIEKLDDMSEGLEKEDIDNILMDSQYLYHSGSRILLNRDNRAISSLLDKQTTKALSLMPVMSKLLGYESSQEYLLLFMNNAELRPTGGFIGSVGRLVVEEGKVSEFDIQDVYDLDGQLTQHIEPHYIIRRHLQPHLYLRDSNFDLDFQRSASISARIYNLESGHTPDGVVAVDFNLIKTILEITGPIELEKYNHTITSENSLNFLQNEIEEDFFPGSTKKKDLLNDLFDNIMLEIENHPEHMVSIGLALPDLLEQKHILLAYQKKEIQSLLSALGFGGQIPVVENKDRDIIYDFVGFNEANISVNKVNQNISRSINYQANLSTRLSRARISIRNSSESEDYKTYLRLITPNNSVFRSLRIDGEEVETIDAVTDPELFEASNFSPDENVYEIQAKEDYNKTIFGTLVTVPRNSVMDIEFSYTNPTLFLNDGMDGYRLNVIKQPGTNVTPSVFDINFPEEFNATGDQITSFGDGSIEFENNLLTDLTLKASFSKE